MVHLASSGASALPQLIFLLFAGAAWLIKIINRPKGAQPTPAPRSEAIGGPQGAGAPAGDETEAEERARHVREEILKKIAERNPSASVRELGNIVKAAYRRREPVGGVAVSAAPASAPIANTPAAVPLAMQAAAGTPPAKTPGALWLDDLRTHDSVRRAILAREILGPPVALR